MRFPNSNFAFFKPTPIVKILLFTMFGSFVFFALLARTSFGYSIYEGLAFQPDKALFQLQLWRFLTYTLLHSLASPFHFLFNGFVLYMIGCELESRWGEKRFISFVALTALGGSLLVELAWLLGLTDSTVVGISAVTMGMLVAWCIIYSYRSIHLFGLIQLTGQQLLWGLIGFEVLSAIAINNVSSTAHFGGMAMGAFLTTGVWRKLPMAKRRFR